MTHPDQTRAAPVRPTTEAILRAMKLAYQDAIAEHRRANIPLPTLPDGKVVYIPAPPADVNDPPTIPPLR